MSCSQKTAKRISQHTLNHLLICSSCDAITVINQHAGNFNDEIAWGQTTTFTATEVLSHFMNKDPIDDSDWEDDPMTRANT